MHSADPVLPAELERSVFEFSAWQNPETIFTLILVAKRVCIWIEPELYHMVAFRKPRSFLMLQSKPAEFLRRHVRGVAIPGNISHVDIERILSKCTGVYDLTLSMEPHWNYAMPRPKLLPRLCTLTNLQRLSTNLFALCGGRGHGGFDAQFRMPSSEELPFASLTHLDIFGLVPNQLWPVFGMLPQLTHLSLNDTALPGPELINAVLGACPVLKVLVVLWTRDVRISPLPDESKINTDPRFCIVRCLYYDFDWECGARGGPDVWRRAEEAVTKKIRARRKGSDVLE
ncbi:hypothetical protein B0H16DRAFT_1416630 [Mycena metata]|uniref:Uncharacterized protein n=1 Tax=Mycena metata TaxID=1033252 RepID=A0AAD7NF07_9AGAR|nr:hypothetical protein B0H16DRAFT_1416630 [Mycena metata]